MPYIGNTIRAADDYRLIDDISSSFNGSTTSFALQVAGSSPVPFPKSPQQVLISVNGVIQEPDPTGSSGFNLVGTNIVFSSAPTNGHAFFGIIYATADYLNAGGNFPSGSLGAPSFTFIGDENTGLYRKSGGSVGFVSDATEIANFDSNGITISSGNLILGDSSGASSDRIVLGAGSDLSILHDGSNSFIDNNTNDLVIRCDGDDLKLLAEDDIVLRDNDDSTNFIQCINGGSVELYHNGSKKAETVSGGFTVTGVCTATSFAGDGSSLSGINTDLVSDTSPQLGGDLDTNSNDINFVTNDKAQFGNSQQLKIYYDGSNSIVTAGGAGDLQLISTFDDVEIRAADNVFIRPKAGEDGIKVLADAAVELYHNNTKKFETKASGATLTGENLTITSTADVDLVLSADTDNVDESHVPTITFQSDGSTTKFKLGVEGAAGDTFTGSETNTPYILGVLNNTNLQVATNSTARWHWTSSGHFYPSANDSYDIGSSNLRVRNIYTGDLHMSNEGSSNDVDSTWGDYTIQEGFEDLYLINNRTGKKFKFNLTEVS